MMPGSDSRIRSTEARQERRRTGSDTLRRSWEASSRSEEPTPRNPEDILTEIREHKEYLDPHSRKILDDQMDDLNALRKQGPKEKSQLGIFGQAFMGSVRKQLDQKSPLEEKSQKV